jgi:hypothetical protein
LFPKRASCPTSTTYHGDGSTCADIDSTQGVCCWFGTCLTVSTETECTVTYGGTYRGGGIECVDAGWIGAMLIFLANVVLAVRKTKKV